MQHGWKEDFQDFGAYWRDVLRHAWHTSFGQIGLNKRTLTWGLGFLIIGSLVHWSLSGDKAVLEELQIWLSYWVIPAIIFLTILFVWNVFYIPYQKDKNKKSTIDELNTRIEGFEEELEPVLKFNFKSEDNKHLEAMEEQIGNRRKIYKVGRVAVKNYSKAKTVEDVEVTLIHYRKDGVEGSTTIDKKLMANSMDQPIVSIPPERTENFNLFRVKGMGNIPHVSLGPFADGKLQQLSPGRYRIKTTASGKGMPRCNDFYFVSFDGGENLTFRPWREGDTSHDAPPKQIWHTRRS